MATIYRFLIEQKTSTSGGGRKDTSPGNGGAKKGAAKKGKNVSIFGGERGGVEHNRKMRALNPLFNKATGGAWEKGMRLTRAATGLIKEDKKGNVSFSGTAIAIIFSYILQVGMRMLKEQQARASKQNAQNYKQLENGFGAIHGAYEISTDFITGRHTYNQNK